MLKWYLQNGHVFESAWWFLLQFKHLKEWEQGFSYLVSNLGRLVFSLSLQHHAKWWWCLDLYRILHLTHLEPWILYALVECSYFQQFLYWGMPEFMLAPQTVVIWLLTLKHQLMRSLALEPLWTSQMLSYMIAISDLKETLITLSLDVITILLKMWLFLII